MQVARQRRPQLRERRDRVRRRRLVVGDVLRAPGLHVQTARQISHRRRTSGCRLKLLQL